MLQKVQRAPKCTECLHILYRCPTTFSDLHLSQQVHEKIYFIHSFHNSIKFLVRTESTSLLPSSGVEVLTPNMTIIGDRVVRRQLKLNEVIGWGPNLIGLVA